MAKKAKIQKGPVPLEIKIMDMIINYTRTAIYSHYDPCWKKEYSSQCVKEKPMYIKPFDIWLKENEHAMADMEKTYLYKLIKDEYEQNVKQRYHSTRGCCDSFCKQYHITPDEFDDRMIHSVTAAASFTVHLATVFSLTLCDPPHFKTIFSGIIGFLEINKLKNTAINCTTTMHWWFNSWIYDFIMSACTSALLAGHESGATSAEQKIIYLSFIFAAIAVLTFEKPDEVPYAFYVTRYYISQPSGLPKSYAFSKAYMIFHALSIRKIDDEVKDISTKDEWTKSIENDPSFENAYSFFDLKNIHEYLQETYTKIKPVNDNVKEFAYFALPYYEKTDIFDVLKNNYDREKIARSKSIINDISEDFERDKYLSDDMRSSYENLARKKKINTNIEDVAWCYVFAIATYDAIKCFRNEETIPLRETMCFDEYVFAHTRRFSKEQKEYKEDLEKIKIDLKKTERNCDKMSKKAAEKDTEIAQLKKKIKELELELKNRPDQTPLIEKIDELSESLKKEKSESTSYKNRIATLETQNKNLLSQIRSQDDNNQRIEELEKLNELLLSEPQEDTRDFTDEELNILYSVKAHLVVPSMDSMRELQKLMPNSRFRFSTDTAKKPTALPRKYDIFFFCLKFCSHADYWSWHDQLIHVPERQVAAHTAGKHNIAREIIKRYYELKEKNMI